VLQVFEIETENVFLKAYSVFQFIQQDSPELTSKDISTNNP
jgi:hypothetical protein